MNWFKHYLIASIAFVVCLCESPDRRDRLQRTSHGSIARINPGWPISNPGKYENAERCFQAALEINSKHAPSYVGLGHVHLKSG